MKKIIIFCFITVFLLLFFSEKVFAQVPASFTSIAGSRISDSYCEGVSRSPTSFYGYNYVATGRNPSGYWNDRGCSVHIYCSFTNGVQLQPKFESSLSDYSCGTYSCPNNQEVIFNPITGISECHCPSGTTLNTSTGACDAPQCPAGKDLIILDPAGPEFVCVDPCPSGFDHVVNGSNVSCEIQSGSSSSAGACPQGQEQQGTINGEPICQLVCPSGLYPGSVNGQIGCYGTNNCPNGQAFGGVNGVYGCYGPESSSSSSAASSANNSSSGASSGSNSSAGSGGDNGGNNGGDNGGNTGGSNSSSGTASSAGSNSSASSSQGAGECDPTDDDYLACIGQGSNPLPDHTQTASGYTSISQVNQAFFNRVSQSAVAQGLSNVANLVDTSGGECPLLEIDLRGTPINVELSTDIHCQLFLLPEVQVTLSTIMLIIFSFFCYRIFASS